MFRELLALDQMKDHDLDLLFPEENEDKKSFRHQLKQRFETLTDNTDVICFALDPNTDFQDEFRDPKASRQIRTDLIAYMKGIEFPSAKMGKTMKQFDEFVTRSGEFASQLNDRIDAIVYWNKFADLELGDLALRFFAMITSSASCERSFSMQKRFRGVLRNRLKAEKMEKMLGIAFSDMDGSHKHRTPTRHRLPDSDDESEDGVVGGEAEHLIRGPMDLAQRDGDAEFVALLKSRENDAVDEMVEDSADEEEEDDEPRCLGIRMKMLVGEGDDVYVANVSNLPEDMIVADDETDVKPMSYEAGDESVHKNSSPSKRLRSRLSKNLDPNISGSPTRKSSRRATNE